MNSIEPHITVATVIERNGKFLLVREHAAGQEVLNQPAGHVEAGETLIQAAFRETLEETAWQVEITDFLGVYVYQPAPGGAVYYRFCFVASALQHDSSQKLDRGIIEALWLSAAELRAATEQHRSPLVMRCMDDYLSGQRMPLSSLYQHPWPLQKR